MRIFVKLMIVFFLFLGNLFANAETLKMLVLPVDLFSVCQNYYCFEEPSEIFSQNIIEKFNYSKQIETMDLYEIRQKATQNPQIKSDLTNVLNKFKKSNQIDFNTLKKISQHFKINNILLVTSTINQNNLRRNLWEVLEVSSAFEIYNSYKLSTNAVLIDSENELILWSSKYQKDLEDNENRFWARDIASAISQYEKIKNYSKQILSPTISQNIIRRFYPQSTEDYAKKLSPNTNVTNFKPNAIENFSNQKDADLGEIETETIFNF